MTGASGVGKTTLVRALDAQAIPGLRCHYFDSIGVPSVTHMTAHFGSPEAWQQSTTERWVTYLVANETGARVALFDTTQLTLAQAEQGFIECVRAWTV